MAELAIDGEDLVLHLTTLERVEGLHGDIRIPRSCVRAVHILDDAIAAVQGWRLGTGLPGYVAVGTFTTSTTKTFAVVHHDSRRGLLVQLAGADFDQLIVGCPDPEGTAEKLSRPSAPRSVP